MHMQNIEGQSLQQEVVAVIPARGGSKGIPRKNLISVLGQPLIYWSIKIALESDKIDRVIVSTDDNEIAKVAQDFGAEVPFIRPEKFAEDTSYGDPKLYSLISSPIIPRTNILVPSLLKAIDEGASS